MARVYVVRVDEEMADEGRARRFCCIYYIAFVTGD